MKRIPIALVFTIAMQWAGTASAHFHAIIPEPYSKWEARKNEAVNYKLIWGHGYEHIFFDIPGPEAFYAISPAGDKVELLSGLKPVKVKAVSGEEKAAYSFAYTPQQRGDHLLCLSAGLWWDEEEGVWLKDYAKAVLHVQSESEWFKPAGQPLEVIPLSRPYGVLPGDALSFQVLYKGKPAAGLRVERELYTKEVPAALPSEPFIAYSAHTDSRGVVTFSFPSSGWFGITAIMEDTGKTRKAEGREGPVVERATLWVYVSGKPK